MAAIAQAAPQIMPIDEVRVGMKGYGLSVFQGTRIEPFAVEVVSVTRNFFLGLGSGGVKRGAIWIRCPDERMSQLGPVQGMSGSPIYLWRDDEIHELGRGGDLIGAFAFGFLGSKQCYVGVQPIEQMIDVASRTDSEQDKTTSQSAASTLQTIMNICDSQGLPRHNTWRNAALAQLVTATGSEHESHQQTAVSTTLIGLAEGKVAPMLLPLTLRSPGLADALQPLLNRSSVKLVAASSTLAGTPPAWINRKSAPLQPGSVLSIPLAYGDMELSASGTVTHITDAGDILAFGHAMEGQGPQTLPIASGYVHFVMPAQSGSFKVGGSIDLMGGLVRDENSAVVGRYDGKYETAAMTISTDVLEQTPEAYQFQLVKHERFTALAAAICAAESMMAVQRLPSDNTVRLNGKLRFAGDRVLEINQQMPYGSPIAVGFALMGPIAALTQNAHEQIMLESVELKTSVTDTVQLAVILGARLDHDELAPGETLGMTIRLQQVNHPPIDKRLELTIPPNVPEGKLKLTITDGPTYIRKLLANRSHLRLTTNGDELFATTKRIVEVRDDMLYVLLDMPDSELAVGRQELPGLPSSRRAMLATNTSTLTTAYKEWIEMAVPMDLVTTGQLKFNVQINRSLERH